MYAFFSDFKAAFDSVARNPLIFKLYGMGVSYKFVKFLEAVYSTMQSAVWTGEEYSLLLGHLQLCCQTPEKEEYSEYFETKSGVKQGCLIFPLLFALYINDLHECLEGGLMVENLNIRLLLYADDIVILADDVTTMHGIIEKLEHYCKMWNLEVNFNKSEIVVFRNGDRLRNEAKWFFKGAKIKITSEFNYLGVVFTPKLKFNNHLEKRNAQAKNALNSMWKTTLVDK